MDDVHLRQGWPLWPQIGLADGLVASGTSLERLVVGADERVGALLVDRLRELAEFRVVHCVGDSLDVDLTRRPFADRVDPYRRLEILAHLSKVEIGERPVVTSGRKPEVREVIRDVRITIAWLGTCASSFSTRACSRRMAAPGSAGAPASAATAFRVQNVTPRSVRTTTSSTAIPILKGIAVTT